MHAELIRIDFALHDILAEPIRAGDRSARRESRTSVSSVNITPLAASSERTIFMTPTESPTLK